VIDPRIDPRLAKDLDAAEDDKLTAYLDTAVPPNWTIGRGHKLPQPMRGQSWAGFTISQTVSDNYFVGDILATYPFCEKLPEWKNLDTPCRQNAMRELVFNIRNRWSGFVVTRAAMQADPPNWQGVHDGLLNSAWAAQVQPHEYGTDGICKLCHTVEANAAPNDYCKGRDGRATRLARYFLTGRYP
jgi:hypothetical protein